VSESALTTGAAPSVNTLGGKLAAAALRIWNPASARVATKTILAMGLAVGGALYLNWQVTPAMITVQMLQAATLGLSVRNSCSRFFASCFAGVVSLILLMLFPQDRFLLVLGYSVWSVFAVYMMQGSRNPYFWLISLFAVPFISMATGGNPHATFDQAVSIASSFGLGGAAVILVNSALWPNPDRLALEAGIKKSLQDVHELFKLGGFVETPTTAPDADRQRLQADLLKTVAGLPGVLAQAAVESAQIDRFRNNYAHFLNDMVMVGSEVIAFRDLLDECLESENLRALLTRSTSFSDGIARLEHELAELAKQADAPRDGSLSVKVGDCPAFAADIDRSRLGEMDRAMLEALLHQAGGVWSGIASARQVLAGLEDPSVPALPVLDPPYKEPFSFTSYRFTWSLTVGLGGFLATYLWLLTNWPGGLKLSILVPVLGAALFANPTPGVPRLVMMGLAVVLSMTWVLYFLVLPLLPNSFLFLYPVLALFMFPIVYCQALPIPALALPGFAGGLIFCMTSNISHPQEFSFPLYVNGAIGLSAAICFMLGYFSFMTWNRPEQEFRQRVDGFFKLCHDTLRTFETAPPDTASLSMLRSRRKALIAAYQQCAKVAGRLPFDRLPEGSRQSVDAFVNALWVLSFRLDTTLRTRIEELADGSLEPERGASLRSAMADQFGALAQAAGKAPATGELRPELVLEENEAYVRALRQAVAEQETRPREAASLLVLAGLHSTLAAAVASVVGRFNAMELPAWRISRF
jgi:uncharacterized membrane protein YccC